MNDSLQGTSQVPLPDALKNTLELAQNRVTLLEGERDRLMSFKTSLQTEVLSLSQLKEELTLANKELSEGITTLKAEREKVKEEILVLETKQSQVAGEVAAAERALQASQKLDLDLVQKIATKGADLKDLEKVRDERAREIKDLEKKVQKFVEAVETILQ